MNMNSDHPGPASSSVWKRIPRFGWVIIVLSVIGIVTYLLLDHRPHVLAALPYAVIILVVGMHLFGHGAHGNHGNHGGSGGPGYDRHAHDDRPRDGSEPG